MIVCLGWGSLIWEQKELKIRGEWKADGPQIAVEYLRQSRDGRITLVIDDIGNHKFPVLWAEMNFSELEQAKENLRKREGTTINHIGFWKTDDAPPAAIPDLADWARSKKADAVLWTALPPKFNGANGRRPTLQEVISHLDTLEHAGKARAEEYMRNTPKQIKTPYRAQLEEHLGQFIPTDFHK